MYGLSECNRVNHWTVDLAAPSLIHGGRNIFNPKWGSIAQSLSLSLSHRPDTTEILLKGRKNARHPSINSNSEASYLVSSNAFHFMRFIVLWPRSLANLLHSAYVSYKSQWLVVQSLEKLHKFLFFLTKKNHATYTIHLKIFNIYRVFSVRRWGFSPPKQSQRSRSILQDRSRSLGLLFLRESPI